MKENWTLENIPSGWYTRYKSFYKKVKEQMPADATILVIGANDGVSHDPIHRVWKSSWRGIFVEPNPRAVEQLKQNVADEKSIFIPAAIGPVIGTLALYSMKKEAAQEYAKVMKADGSSLTSANWEHIATRIKRRIPHMIDENQTDVSIGKLIESIAVPAVTVEHILDTCEIPRVNLIQIDVEGMEMVVLEEIAGLIKKKRIHPHIILYEHQHLLTTDKRSIGKQYNHLGYHCEIIRNDTMIWRDTWP